MNNQEIREEYWGRSEIKEVPTSEVADMIAQACELDPVQVSSLKDVLYEFIVFRSAEWPEEVVTEMKIGATISNRTEYGNVRLDYGVKVPPNTNKNGRQALFMKWIGEIYRLADRDETFAEWKRAIEEREQMREQATALHEEWQKLRDIEHALRIEPKLPEFPQLKLLAPSQDRTIEPEVIDSDLEF